MLFKIFRLKEEKNFFQVLYTRYDVKGKIILFIKIVLENNPLYLFNWIEFPAEKYRFFSQYLDRCGKYERAIDNRMKEIRLAHHEVDETHVHDVKKPRRREAKKKEKHPEKEKEKNKEKEKDKEKNKERKRSRLSRVRKSIPKISAPELTKAETEYCRVIDEVKYSKFSRAIIFLFFYFFIIFTFPFSSSSFSFFAWNQSTQVEISFIVQTIRILMNMYI